MEAAFAEYWDSKKEAAISRSSVAEGILTEVLRRVIDEYLYDGQTPTKEYLIGELEEQPGILSRVAVGERLLEAVLQVVEIFDNYAFNDSTHVARTDIDGTPRPFDSFYHFADEAAISRLYGGIHFRSAIDVGVEQGIEIGRNVEGIRFK